MAKNLIVVESPAKAKTIDRYLGKDFKAIASYGHIRDLLDKSGAVDVDSDFEMKYTTTERQEKYLDKIITELKKADALYLATDPDREGEAISWHLLELLKEHDVLEDKPVKRVVFHEITKTAIQKAVDNGREIEKDLVDAYRARRALDHLVGFNISPLLWKKVTPGLSAGRVQSPALRMIVEREYEIEAFIPKEYWSIDASANKDKKSVKARLYSYNGEKVEQFSFVNEKQAISAQEEIEKAANGILKVTNVVKKERKRNPAPPFTTSTFQQEASRKLRLGTQRSMRIAQKLYEGIKLEGETTGLITYMRTDSVNLADEAINEARTVIGDKYGSADVPKEPRTFKNRAKNAQEAHEAIRPTSFARTPESVKAFLDEDQLKVYTLIWKRAIASQMIHATLDTVAVDLNAGDNVFRANGSVIKNAGFFKLYQESLDAEDKDKADDSKETHLPAMEVGDEINLESVNTYQHFTEPPPRYSEASLVKALEAHGIGRPSTYATIISTLINRKYSVLENRAFHATDIGKAVNYFLTNHFTSYVDYEFTAKLEDSLDAVSRGERKWVPLMKDFWQPFKELVDEKDANVTRKEATLTRDLGTDPKSGRPVSVRVGRYGAYVQIGSVEDEEKPKFAGLMPDQSMDTISLDEALYLFNLPRDLGETAEGEKVRANIGRFGPYVQYGSKYVSLKEDDPYKIELPRALELIKEKKEEDARRLIADFGDIKVLNGRYGPYITDGNKNAKIPKDQEPSSLTQQQCEELLAQAPERRGRRGAAASKKKTSTTTPPKKSAKKKTTAKKASTKNKSTKTTKGQSST